MTSVCTNGQVGNYRFFQMRHKQSFDAHEETNIRFSVTGRDRSISLDGVRARRQGKKPAKCQHQNVITMSSEAARRFPCKGNCYFLCSQFMRHKVWNLCTRSRRSGVAIPLSLSLRRYPLKHRVHHVEYITWFPIYFIHVTNVKQSVPVLAK